MHGGLEGEGCNRGWGENTKGHSIREEGENVLIIQAIQKGSRTPRSSELLVTGRIQAEPV